MAWSWAAHPYFNATENPGFYGMFQYSNTATDSMLGIMIVGMIFIISFLAMKRYPAYMAMAISGYITTILAVMLRILGLVGDPFLMIMILITAIATMLTFFKER